MGVNEYVQYIRENFEKKYAENISSGMYDARDIERLQKDTTFVRSYIRGRDRLDEGVDLVHSSFKFRKEIKVNDLNEDSFDKELWDLGGMYFHGRDINGNRILWLKVKVHKKDAPAERLFMERQGLMFALEKAFNESSLHQVVVLLDMTACGLVNLDIDFVKFIITIFKFYYPTFLSYILIYDMPWIFNAAWKVIKAWLSPEAVAKIKFVTKTDIQTYIKPEALPNYMGGTDDFVYVYKRGMANEPLYPEDTEKKEKKVHFQEVQEYSSLSNSPRTSMDSDTDSSPVDINANARDGVRHRTHNHKKTNANNSAHDNKRSLVLGRSHSSHSASTYVGRLLTVSPAEELVFQTSEGGDSFDIITLSNTLPFPVAFKVKTTSPEKFRVRPSAGILAPDKSEEIYVYLVPEYSADVSKDKFLIMAMEVVEGSDANQMFKNAPKDKVMQHKLKCGNPVSPVPSAEKEPAGVKIDPVIAKTATASPDQVTPSVSKPGIRRPGGHADGPHNYSNARSRGPPPPTKQSSKTTIADEIDKQVEQLEAQTRHMRRQLNLLLAIQILTAFTLLLVMLSYSCLGEDLFTRYLALPFDFCNDPYGRKC